MQTYLVAGIHFATLKIKGQDGGYIGRGATVQEAIKNLFNIMNK